MNRTILCVDDYPQVLMLYKQIFEDREYKVVLASSGWEGLESLNRYPVDCIVLDYQMPGMDGEAVIEHLRCREAPPPVILVSGSDLPRQLQEQAEAVVQKPIRIAELLECVEAVIGDREMEHQPQQLGLSGR